MPIKNFIGFVLTIAGLLLLAISLKYFPKALLTLIFSVMLCAAACRFVYQIRRVTWCSKWTVIRRIRKMRKAFLASPNALALYAGCLVSACAVALVAQISNFYLSTFLIALTGIFLCIATIVDWYGRLRYLLASTWAARAALVLLSFLGATTIFVSNVIANRIVFYIAMANPENMPEFVRLASALVYPFSLALSVSASLVLIMTMQSAAMLIGVVAATTFKQFSTFTTPRFQREVKDLAYRLIKGVKRPKSLPWWEKWVGGLQIFFRPIGTGVIAASVVFIVETALKIVTSIPLPYLQQALVVTEYTMGTKEASAYVQKEHGGWGWWTLKVLVTGAGLVILAITLV